MSSTKFVDRDWKDEFEAASRLQYSDVQIVCPFIKRKTLEDLLSRLGTQPVRVMTRFSLQDFASGVNDLESLQVLLDHGAQIRGVKNLHAKLYVFGQERAIVTSANLTDAAMMRNHEFGVISDDPDMVQNCRKYIDVLWNRAGPNLISGQLDEWKLRLSQDSVGLQRPIGSALPDYGADVGFSPDMSESESPLMNSAKAFLKFSGEGSSRLSRKTAVLEEVERSRSASALYYPKNKRPRSVENNSLMFISALVSDPDDVLIYGHAFALAYQERLDDLDISQRNEWDPEGKWPHFIRVRDAKFIEGTLDDGVSLNELMNELGSDAFASTQRNARKGEGNTEPRRSMARKASMQLTPESNSWIVNKLMAAYRNRGQFDVKDLDTTKEFSPEQLEIIGQLRSELGDVVSRKRVREWFQNKTKQNGEPYAYAPPWIVKNRYLLRPMKEKPDRGECVLSLSNMPDRPYDRIRSPKQG